MFVDMCIGWQELAGQQTPNTPLGFSSCSRSGLRSAPPGAALCSQIPILSIPFAVFPTTSRNEEHRTGPEAGIPAGEQGARHPRTQRPQGRCTWCCWWHWSAPVPADEGTGESVSCCENEMEQHDLTATPFPNCLSR